METRARREESAKDLKARETRTDPKGRTTLRFPIWPLRSFAREGNAGGVSIARFFASQPGPVPKDPKWAIQCAAASRLPAHGPRRVHGEVPCALGGPLRRRHTRQALRCSRGRRSGVESPLLHAGPKGSWGSDLPSLRERSHRRMSVRGISVHGGNVSRPLRRIPNRLVLREGRLP